MIIGGVARVAAGRCSRLRLRNASTSTAAAAAASTSSSSPHHHPPPPTPSQLIAAAQPHIPPHGFTHAALRAGLTSPIDDWTLDRLFPGGLVGETSVPVRLFRRWDADQRHAAIKDDNRGGGGINDASTSTPASLLEARLRRSDPVKHHLSEVSARSDPRLRARAVLHSH